MSAPRAVRDLVAFYRKNEAEWLTQNETETRLQLINPFFEALGWDMINKGRRTGTAREVVHEASLLVGESTKAPDYLIRTKGRNRFYIEAKKPSVNVSAGRQPAYQIRRYGWNAGTPFGVVTDFQEFAVYDCREQPAPTDSAHVARLKYLTFEQYDDEWDWIAERFSREAVLGGALDRMVAAGTKARATRSVDAAFLEEMQSWRLSLAKDLARRNKDLTQPELNYAVQAIIDRIVFLRIAEARGLEPANELDTLTRGPNIYTRLVEVFQRADARYNSGLFHFRQERGRAEAPDDLTLNLAVGDETLRYLLGRLYYPEPYEFSVISADILGQAYEQFLGQVITLDDKHQANVETKIEVRRAGGVYYTPSYIVEYIVEQTLSALLKGKSVAEAANIKVLDPACGSGSFLIVAYQHLLDWHLDRYTQSVRQNQRFLEPTDDGGWRLNAVERKRILVNNIFGVDIDAQAVEVTKLSLLLKVIEGESQLAFAVGRLLPDLENNIKCGNSLIAPDLPQPLDMTDEQWASYNPFSWDAAFPLIMKGGGFDAVIGNPPYLSVDDSWGAQDPRLAYLKSHYGSVYTDKTDLLFYFLKISVELARSEVGVIVSRAFLEAHKAEKLRTFLADRTSVREIIDFRNAIIFPKIGITTSVVHLTKTGYRKSASFRQLKPPQMPPGVTSSDLHRTDLFSTVPVAQKDFGSASWRYAEADLQTLLKRIDAAGDLLGDILHIGQGMQTGQNKVFSGIPRAELAVAEVPTGSYFIRARNSDIQPYRIRDSDIALIYPEDAARLDDLPKVVRDHLRRHETDLKARAAYQRGNCLWWRYTWPLHRQYMGRAKILSPYLAARNRFALDADGTYLGLTDTTVLYDNKQPEDLRYLLGLLNSRLLTLRFRYIGKLKAGGVIEYFENTVSRLPIPRRKASDPQHQEMVRLVTQITGLVERLAVASTPADHAALENRISAVQASIDTLVYAIYSLTDAEIAQVEAEFALPLEAVVTD